MPHLRRIYALPPDLEEAAIAVLWMAGTLGVHPRPRPTAGCGWRPGFPSRPIPSRCSAVSSWRSRRRFPTPTGSPPGGSGPSPSRSGGPSISIPASRRTRLPRSPTAGGCSGCPPARAFGTGSHESTSLALELLEDADLRGRRVLDVGTGTGVLAFAALLFGAKSVVGFDVDPASPFHARDNSALNGLHPRLFAGRLAAVRERPRFDLALVNVVPEQILPEMPGPRPPLAPGAEAILSGILAERGRQVLDRMRGLGFVERDRRAAGDWVAFRVAGRRRRPAGHWVALRLTLALHAMSWPPVAPDLVEPAAPTLTVEGESLPASLPGPAGGGGGGMRVVDGEGRARWGKVARVDRPRPRSPCSSRRRTTNRRSGWS